MKGEKVSAMKTDELIKLQKIKKITAPMTWRIVRSKGEEAIIEYARLMKYRNGWVERQIQAMDSEKITDTETGEIMNGTSFGDFKL